MHQYNGIPPLSRNPKSRGPRHDGGRPSGKNKPTKYLSSLIVASLALLAKAFVIAVDVSTVIPCGLRAAHTSGKGGMKRSVKSGGKYNPSDELGTSLKDCYNNFSKS